ncbi:transposase [Streptomyces viridiviolaceus]|uniref:Transposase n=1 Tax=Streptomyces viridiviolaceus TaxID=68282 RepID=A0ABW2E2Y9_9ACTN|nr:transposase [Streptomyces viridiviolaceus]
MVDHGRVIRRHELSDVEWEFGKQRDLDGGRSGGSALHSRGPGPGTHDECNPSFPPSIGVTTIEPLSISGFIDLGQDEASPAPTAAHWINGRKRHITVDTLGLPVMITVTPADIQDRDAARDVFWRLRLTQPQITQIWADRGYAGDLVDWARDRFCLTLRIVSRAKGTKGFVVLPRRMTRRLTRKAPAPTVGQRSPPADLAVLVCLEAEQHLWEPAATPLKGMTLMLGMVVWDVRSRASTRER